MNEKLRTGLIEHAKNVTVYQDAVKRCECIKWPLTPDELTGHLAIFAIEQIKKTLARLTEITHNCPLCEKPCSCESESCETCANCRLETATNTR